MAAADTLRQLLDAGKNGKRLDEISSARVIGKVALQVHAAQQKAGHGKAVGPITPNAITFAPNGAVTFTQSETSSFGYSSPEQLSGSGDRRSDVFSLGTVLWEVLTYQRLFDAMNDAAVKIAVTDRAITPPSEVNANVPAELSAICMRALARNPADRYQSLKAMAVEIEEFLEEAGYEDSDDKVAQYLKQMPRTLKVDTTPPLTRTAGGTQPPPLAATSFSRPASASQPPPSILTSPPIADAPKPSAGHALASALAKASSSGTSVGVPAAPAPEPVPLVPMPPILPGQAPVRNDKSTISVAVPPQVKVATTAAVIEAKHTESKPQAVIVEEEKPKALIVEDNPAQTSPGLGQVLREPAKIEAPTVELKKPLEAPPVVASVAKAEEPKAEPPKAEAKEATPRVEENKPEPAAEAKAETKQRAPSQSDSTPAKPIVDKKSAPHAAAAVSLGPAPRDSKGDVLAGWGWGTDKHNAIAPDGYVPDDEDLHAPPDNKKLLIKVFGGGLAVAALITIIAFAAGGSSDKKKQSTKPVAAQAATADKAPPAPPANPQPPVVESAGSAEQVDPAAAEKAAAEQAALDKAAAEKAAADQAAAEKAAAEQAALDKKAAEKLAAEQAAADKKAAADQAAADKRAAADKQAAEKAAAAQALADKRAADKAAAEQKAAERKAAAEKLAAEKRAAQEKLAAQRKAAADKAATTKTTTPKTTRPTTTTTAKTTVAKTETKTEAKTEGKVDVETAYRQGLQQFARGDTAGALSSLRTSLAANPNYAPTWRGLGLVFEKMGEKEQARAAYKRYLQLAPAANDSEQIKGRLERLGS